MATVSGTYGPLETVAISASGRSSARLWAELSKPSKWAVAVGDPPQPPWCAARLLPPLMANPDAVAWLGDYERCLAWAWIEGRA